MSEMICVVVRHHLLDAKTTWGENEEIQQRRVRILRGLHCTGSLWLVETKSKNNSNLRSVPQKSNVFFC